ncbi:MAG: hypothetical protein ACI9K2_003871 [Myxococcota bacterium]
MADPAPRARWLAPEPVPRDPATLRTWLLDQLTALDWLEHAGPPPAESPLWWSNSLTAQRQAQFFAEAMTAVDAFHDSERDPARLVIAELRDLAIAGELRFDDEDSGTYHSFGKDAPFVHFLEQLLDGLPREASDAMAVLPPEQQQAVRRQRDQATAWLDALMRRKYDHDGVREADVERSVGGWLIDRSHRQVLSLAEGADHARPTLVLLRVEPSAAHPDAGAWVYRDGDRLMRDGRPVQHDPPVRTISVEESDLTFRRAPDDPNLPHHLPFDWDGDGWAREDAIAWVEWAGHCDIKAIVEATGLTLAGLPPVSEHRTDTLHTQEWNRDLLLELLSAGLELGSTYRHVDGSMPEFQRGDHRFGGARNDSLPDRLQLYGLGEGNHVRWPRTRQATDFVVTAIRDPAGPADVQSAFLQHRVDPAVPSFGPNPRFSKYVEGDYALIDATGLVLEARVRVDGFDPTTGRPTVRHEPTTIDLSDGPGPDRCYLGTVIWDAARRDVLAA